MSSKNKYAIEQSFCTDYAEKKFWYSFSCDLIKKLMHQNDLVKYFKEEKIPTLK